MLRSKEYAIKYKMEEGDILNFNNKRILHGRTEYDATTTSRFLHGCYLDWDEVKSTFRVLRARMSHTE